MQLPDNKENSKSPKKPRQVIGADDIFDFDNNKPKEASDNLVISKDMIKKSSGKISNSATLI